MPPQVNREFLSTDEAHEKTGLSLRYLQQLLKDKRLEGFKAGPVWFVYADSLSAFVEQPRKRGPKGPHKKSRQVKGSEAVDGEQRVEEEGTHGKEHETSQT
jgi:excisionase family DNA binding protein